MRKVKKHFNRIHCNKYHIDVVNFKNFIYHISISSLPYKSRIDCWEQKTMSVLTSNHKICKSFATRHFRKNMFFYIIYLNKKLQIFKMVESYFLIDKGIFSITACSTIRNLFLAIGRILVHIFLAYNLVLLIATL